eukprot:9500070-Pyramimonas_sp.AAC.1
MKLRGVSLDRAFGRLSSQAAKGAEKGQSLHGRRGRASMAEATLSRTYLILSRTCPVRYHTTYEQLMISTANYTCKCLSAGVPEAGVSATSPELT